MRFLLAFAMLGATAKATSFNYGFDGDFAAAFTRANAEDDRYFFDQEDGALAYFRRDPLPTLPTDPENNLAYLSNTFSPRNDQSWEVGVDVTIPSVYDQQNPISQFLQAGIVAFHAPNGLSSDVGFRAFETTLRLEALQGPVARALFGAVDDGAFPPQDAISIASAVETVTLSIRFDAAKQELAALADGQEYYRTAIDATGPIDWSMEAGDTFQIALIADSALELVDGDNAVVFDNFTASIIPEPATAVLYLCGVAGVLTSRRGVRRAGPGGGWLGS